VRDAICLEQPPPFAANHSSDDVPVALQAAFTVKELYKLSDARSDRHDAPPPGPPLAPTCTELQFGIGPNRPHPPTELLQQDSRTTTSVTLLPAGAKTKAFSLDFWARQQASRQMGSIRVAESRWSAPRSTTRNPCPQSRQARLLSCARTSSWPP